MIDWATRITDLEAKGWSLKAIGEEIGLSTSSVSDIKRGATSEPRGMAAVRLHKLHAQLGDPQDAAPVHRPPAAKAGAAAETAEASPLTADDAARRVA